ncbi:MAG: DUF427 domain-containing protein [Candidatus Hermodarchaeia archaeon]|jgi:uncharacterized protein (DUF427 family)
MNPSREQKRESVWDYPRPPRVEPSSRHIRVVFNNTAIAETSKALRVLETSHPPVYYIPPRDVQQQFLSHEKHQSYCEFKGLATYYTLKVGEKVSTNAAWSYHNPSSGYESIKDYIAFYPGRVDACYLDGERVQAQEGDFYGGWITSDIEGPFKGGPGTAGW